MTNKMKDLRNKLVSKKRKGFTLIELVIVVAIIGILALMVVPQFNKVTDDAKKATFTSNHRTIVSAMGMYQAANQGDLPTTGSQLNDYLDGNFSALDGKPTGATYAITSGKLTSTYGSTTIKFPE